MSSALQGRRADFYRSQLFLVKKTEIKSNLVRLYQAWSATKGLEG